MHTPHTLPPQLSAGSANTLCFLRLSSCVCIHSKAWLAAACHSGWLACLLRRGAHVAYVPRLRLRPSFSRTCLVHTVCRKHRVSAAPSRPVISTGTLHIGAENVHALECLACRKHVAPASSPAAPASRVWRLRLLWPSRACFGHKAVLKR